MENCWVDSSAGADVPRFTVVGGYDCDGDAIYVGRAMHDGENLPAKVIPGKDCAYVPFNSKEHAKTYYELLVGPGYSWESSENGNVPSNAVCSGYSNGEPLFVGRGFHHNSLTVGKVHPSHGGIYLPFGGQEIHLANYEVLVSEIIDNWQEAPLGHLPNGAVVAGYDSDSTAIYVARSFHNGEMLPAKYVPQRCEAYVSINGCEVQANNIEVLCGFQYSWLPASIDDIPNNAVFSGHSEYGKPLFVGRAHHNGSLTPGLVSIDKQCLLMPYGGAEVRKNDFEILIRQ